MSYDQNRIERLRALMKTHNIDVFYIRELSNIKWATGFDGVFDDEDAHALIVDTSSIILHTDSRYYHAALEASLGRPIEVDCSQKTHSDCLVEFLEELNLMSESLNSMPEFQRFMSDSQGPLKVGIEQSMSLREYRLLELLLYQNNIDAEIVETSFFVLELRAVKDPQEIMRLKAAQAISDQAFSHMIDFIKPGMTERKVQLELESYMLSHGASSLAFSSIVAAGPNGANPHAIPGESVLEAGQGVVMDFGARVLGYCSDMTRMVFLGEPDAQVKKAYEAIREANESVASFLKPGVSGAQAQELAESILASRGFEGGMDHSLGHGVGIDVHEKPVLARMNDAPLEVGNVLTIEPGIYVPGKFGMRLEDFGIIRANGFDKFTQSTHDMVII